MFIEKIQLDEFYFSFGTKLYTEDTLCIYRSGKVAFYRYREDRTIEHTEWKIPMSTISLLSRLAHVSNFPRFYKSYMPRLKELTPRSLPMEHAHDYYCVYHLSIKMEIGRDKTTIFSMMNTDTPARLKSLTEQIVELSGVKEQVRGAFVFCRLPEYSDVRE